MQKQKNVKLRQSDHENSILTHEFTKHFSFTRVKRMLHTTKKISVVFSKNLQSQSNNHIPVPFKSNLKALSLFLCLPLLFPRPSFKNMENIISKDVF